MNRVNERPPFVAMASDAKRFLGLRTDIRELINVCSLPSGNCISKTLQHPVLDQMHKILSSNLRGDK